MAPDADKLRHRTTTTATSEGAEPSTVSTSDNLAATTIPVAALRSNEVIIDGVIYDITSFEHPGGDSIQIFGGNDATVFYRMIHPYHTSKQVSKMKRVGEVPNYFCQ